MKDSDSTNLTKLNMRIVCAKRVLFDMWHIVDTGQASARSLLGDHALRLRDALFSTDEHQFNIEYSIWLEKRLYAANKQKEN